MRSVLLLLAVALCTPLPAADAAAAQRLEAGLRRDWHGAVRQLLAPAPGKSALFVLDRGEHALRIRAWLARKAQRSLDVQTFIWADDNVGRLAGQAVLAAARRGVHCRLLIDDLLLERVPQTLLALDRHPGIEVRIYNPGMSVGIPVWRRWLHVAGDFRGANQRMHHKAFIADGLAGISGGRNLAEEYYDFNHGFDFRDRELLAAGPAVAAMQAAFDAFWDAPQSVRLSRLLPQESAALGDAGAQAAWAALDAAAADPAHLDPAVEAGIEAVPAAAADLLAGLDRCDARYLSDHPGKNAGEDGLGGGGATTRALAEALRGAQREVLIQSPYLILSEPAFALFQALTARGVKVRISTNSAANSDNLQAVAGYQRQRARLLAAGIQVYEQRPTPANQGARMLRRPPGAIFVVHAKTLVVDRQRLFVGTFNLDPRSMNLNTEAGLLAESPKLAEEVAQAIEEDLAPENSWDVAAGENGDAEAPWSRRAQLFFWRRLPIEPIL